MDYRPSGRPAIIDARALQTEHLSRRCSSKNDLFTHTGKSQAAFRVFNFASRPHSVQRIVSSTSRFQ